MCLLSRTGEPSVERDVGRVSGRSSERSDGRANEHARRQSVNPTFVVSDGTSIRVKASLFAIQVTAARTRDHPRRNLLPSLPPSLPPSVPPCLPPALSPARVPPLNRAQHVCLFADEQRRKRCGRFPPAVTPTGARIAIGRTCASTDGSWRVSIELHRRHRSRSVARVWYSVSITVLRCIDV